MKRLLIAALLCFSSIAHANDPTLWRCDLNDSTLYMMVTEEAFVLFDNKGAFLNKGVFDVLAKKARGLSMAMLNDEIAVGFGISHADNQMILVLTNGTKTDTYDCR